MTGAALATVIPASGTGKVAAFAVGFLSHYVLDALPHWERLFGPHYNEQLPRNHKLWPRHIYIQGSVDIFIGLVLLGYFIFKAPGSYELVIFLGGVGGILPDLIDSAPWWKHLTKEVPFWSVISKLHQSVHMDYKKQMELPSFTGLITQLVVTALSLAILINFLH